MKKLFFMMISGVLALGLSAAHADSSNANGSGAAGQNTQIQEQGHSDGAGPRTGQQDTQSDAKYRDNLNQQHGNQADQMRRDNSGSGQSDRPARQQ